jgi:transcription initiation factor TFIIB
MDQYQTFRKSKNKSLLSIEKCNECGSCSLIEDRRQGDLLCNDCGLVIHAHIIDFSSEWRNFSDDTRNQDPNRVGTPVHQLLESNPGTIISKGLKGSNLVNEKLIKVQNQSGFQKTDRYLNQVFKKMSFFIENGFLSPGIKQKVEELFKLYFNHLTLRTNGNRIKFCLRKDETLSIIAASFFIILKNQGKPRTFKEIEYITKVSKKTIGSKVRAIERSLGGIKISKYRNTENFVSRFCSQLGLPFQISNLAENIAMIIREKPGIYGRTYVSIAAASIYIITQLPFFSFNCSLKEIANVTGIGEVTLKDAYKSVYPYRNEILKFLAQKNKMIKFSYSKIIPLLQY